MTAASTVRADVGIDLSEATILVIDGDAAVLELLSTTLRFQGCDVHTAATGPAAVELARRVRPAAVISEVALPGTDGFAVLRELRAQHVNAPVVFLTARDALVDKLTGLNVGGDDYITKPFSLEEVVVRLRVVLRRSRGEPGEIDRVLTFADIELDERTRQVSKAGEPVTLAPMEFELLRHFLCNPGAVLSKTAIGGHLWPDDHTVDLNLVESYVSHLRRKIDTGDSAILHTLRGRGYVMDMRPPLTSVPV